MSPLSFYCAIIFLSRYKIWHVFQIINNRLTTLEFTTRELNIKKSYQKNYLVLEPGLVILCLRYMSLNF